MGIISVAVSHLIKAGLSGGDLVNAVAEIEQEVQSVSADALRKRRENDAERKRRSRANGRGHVTSRDKRDTPDKESSPRPPKEINPPYPASPDGDAAPPPANDETELRPEHVVEAWNEMAGNCGLPKVRDLSDPRRRKLQTLIRRHTVDDFTEAIGAIERSPWMHGGNDRGWRADFDFLITPTKFTRLIEGSYDQSTHR